MIGDCHSSALVSRAGSIDWCCTPRFDSASVFGRILDWERGGFCQIAPTVRYQSTRRYRDGSMILETTFRTGGGEVRLTDLFTMRQGGARKPHLQLLRCVDGLQGRVDVRVEVCPRFDYGEVRPWIRRHGPAIHSATGGNDCLLIQSDASLEPTDGHDLGAEVAIRAGDRIRLSIQFLRPEFLEEHPQPVEPDRLDRRLDESDRWWRRWSSKIRVDGPNAAAAVRSAVILKALTNASTGAMVAAPTTSLPSVPGGRRNWDYRYSWIRDSTFAVQTLAELGAEAEAEGFRRFIQRSAAGNVEDLQTMYGVGGERRLHETELAWAEGHAGARPVRVGNAAGGQLQLDMYGLLLDLTWRWHLRGRSPDDDLWRFLVGLVDAAARRWTEPDRGIWEVRGKAEHFVHSKVMCWVALDRGLWLAGDSDRVAPTARWQRMRSRIRRAVETDGYDARRGVFVRAFGSTDVDAALLLLPSVGFVEATDERMVRTVDAIRDRLDQGGLIGRYRARDGLPGTERAWVACSYWLVQVLAQQGRLEEAQEIYDRTTAAANDVGLFSEVFDVRNGAMLGNFPLGLSHFAHIGAVRALLLANVPPGRVDVIR
jgi:GH15 family glucan-1,4-alpha-glucosidase